MYQTLFALTFLRARHHCEPPSAWRSRPATRSLLFLGCRSAGADRNGSKGQNGWPLASIGRQVLKPFQVRCQPASLLRPLSALLFCHAAIQFQLDQQQHGRFIRLASKPTSSMVKRR